MATFTNHSKNTINPSNKNKGIGAEWADLVASWSDAFYGWAESESVSNLSKTMGTGGLWIVSVNPWQLSSPWTVTIGAIAWSNQNKN